MITKTWKMTAVSVAFAVWFAYSAPVRALPGTESVGKLSPGAAMPLADDEGDGLDGLQDPTLTPEQKAKLDKSKTPPPDLDDDDDMSGGALAVLLLLQREGAESGDPPRPPQGGTQNPSFSFERTCGNTTKVTKDKSAETGKTSRSEWTANIDPSSRLIKLTRDMTEGAGRRILSEWKGRLDGEFYPLKGTPKADELSFTLDGRTLTSTAKKLAESRSRGN